MLVFQACLLIYHCRAKGLTRMAVYMGGMCPGAAQYYIAAVHRVSAGLRAMIV